MTPLDKYIKDYSSPQSEALEWLERETHLRTNHARMLSGNCVGKLLGFISGMLRPEHILELGTFTGYSAICMADGLDENGILDTIEVNDELEDLIREGFERAGFSDRIHLHFGDAKLLIPTFDYQFDMVYIDANKREYVEYYNLVIDKVKRGGFIIADNVLWDGKVYDDQPSNDAQTQSIIRFNELIANDSRVENVILPLRDGINLIRVK